MKLDGTDHRRIATRANADLFISGSDGTNAMALTPFSFNVGFKLDWSPMAGWRAGRSKPAKLQSQGCGGAADRLAGVIAAPNGTPVGGPVVRWIGAGTDAARTAAGRGRASAGDR